MNTILIKLIILIAIPTFLIPYGAICKNDKQITSEQKKASATFRRLMETAHPLPVEKPKINFNIPLADEKNFPIFYNKNLIEPESDRSPIQNESSIAVNPKNPKNLISSAVDYRDSSSTWVYVSSDGGRSWKNLNLKKPYPGWRSTNDPSVAFDPDGVGYLVYGGFGTIEYDDQVMYGENGVFIARTTNEGETWQAHIPVIVHKGQQTLDSTFEDKYYISIDNSPSSPYYKDLYIPWKRVSPRDSATQIVISKSSDKGLTWSNPVPVSERLPGSSEDTTYGQSFPLAATGPDGQLYVVWNHGIEHAVGFAKSMDGGKTFSEPKIIHKYNIFGVTNNISSVDTIQTYRHTLKKVVRAEAYPVIVCDTTNSPRRGYIYLCWAADREPNIYFSRSTDEGETWSQPKIIHSETANDQFWQWLSIDPMNGDIAIMYLDSRNDTNNLMVECYVSYSSDGGSTWLDRRTSDINSDIRRNPFENNCFAGDYNGNAFYNGMIYPSWVDMRNTKQSILDNDVYTAIINTRSPAPIENLTAKIIPDKPENLELRWDKPTERAFGQPLDDSEFNYALFRDSVFLTNIPGVQTAYTDNNLTPYKKYEYSIIAFSGIDSSIARETSAFAGGARNPAPATIISSTGNTDNNVDLLIKLPGYREDNVTPLVNLSKIALYRDNEFIKEFDVLPTDTGRIVKISDQPQERGYYTYLVKILDGSSTPNQSPESNIVTLYTGIIENRLTESFDNALLPRYLNIGGWGATTNFYKSPSKSLTESPAGDYINNSNYIMQFFPIIADDVELNIEFWHAAIINRTDTGFIDISMDNGKSWTTVAKFNHSNYSFWEDGVLNASDWKRESFRMPVSLGDKATLRFRFETNAFKFDDGWYIDDLDLYFKPVGVKEAKEISEELNLFPNPASEMAVLYASKDEIIKPENISIFSILGTSVKNYSIQANGSQAIVDISELEQGIYIICHKIDDSVIYKKITVIR